ncbi:hypothetical protein EUZ85_20570 [Hahella sp. KA22]|uniref:lipopolysaccharide biosynthesis protein n=1 Tax=Hahella sp. KA22 TaxID=1628392 RepID=UPI000FDF5F05|nr:oligosaccharide flippase family protein [Hahella sp. KA22]AZZ92994.1 hypothetical protein ENC22_17990 [Hahella sp. KA22]QAY56368.1 hypothetical protein EUZ85_20570 [Hahella sp. KA22]
MNAPQSKVTNPGAVKQTKVLVSNTAIYGLGTIIRSLASFLLLPIYTQYLLPSEYGVIELLGMLVDLAGIFFGARIGQAFLRYYGLANTDNEKYQVTGSALGMTCGMHLLAVLTLISLSGPISELLFGSSDFKTLVQLYSLNMLLGALMEIPFAYLRANGKALKFLGYSVLRLTLQISFNLFFLIYLEMGVYGAVYASVIAFSLAALGLTLGVVGELKPEFKWETAKSMLGFSFPIIIAALSMFFITYSDRYFISAFLDLDSVGIYSLAYKFGFMLFALGWTPFLNMWDAEKYRIYKDQESHYLFDAVFRVVSGILVYMAFGIALWLPVVLRFMSDENYWGAASIAPIVLIAYVLLAWTNYCNLGFFTEGKTGRFGWISVVTAIFCVLGYWVSIPKYGMYGAAWVTVLAFLVRFLLIHHFAKRHFDMQLKWRSHIVSLALALSFYLISEYWIFSDMDPVGAWAIAIRVALSLLYPVLAIALGVIPFGHLKMFYLSIIKKRGK